MHIKGIDGKIVRSEVEGLEHLGQGKFFPVADNYAVLLAGLISVFQTIKSEGKPLDCVSSCA